MKKIFLAILCSLFLACSGSSSSSGSSNDSNSNGSSSSDSNNDSGIDDGSGIDSDDDKPSTESNYITIEGTVIHVYDFTNDDTVCYDRNRNKECDPDEPQAKIESDTLRIESDNLRADTPNFKFGKFKIDNVTNVDYAATPLIAILHKTDDKSDIPLIFETPAQYKIISVLTTILNAMTYQQPTNSFNELHNTLKNMMKFADPDLDSIFDTEKYKNNTNLYPRANRLSDAISQISMAVKGRAVNDNLANYTFTIDKTTKYNEKETQTESSGYAVIEGVLANIDNIRLTIEGIKKMDTEQIKEHVKNIKKSKPIIDAIDQRESANKKIKLYTFVEDNNKYKIKLIEVSNNTYTESEAIELHEGMDLSQLDDDKTLKIDTPLVKERSGKKPTGQLTDNDHTFYVHSLRVTPMGNITADGDEFELLTDEEESDFTDDDELKFIKITDNKAHRFDLKKLKNEAHEIAEDQTRKDELGFSFFREASIDDQKSNILNVDNNILLTLSGEDICKWDGKNYKNPNPFNIEEMNSRIGTYKVEDDGTIICITEDGSVFAYFEADNKKTYFVEYLNITENKLGFNLNAAQKIIDNISF